MGKLRRGDLLPRILHPAAGATTRRMARQLLAHEAPGINTLDASGATRIWQEARGSNVLDVDGNRYIDLTSGFGVAAVGHRHPEVVRAVRHQAGSLLHGLGDVHAHPLRIELARELTRRAPIEDARVYFAVSGSDAVEIAVKTALLATGRSTLLAFEPAYHGLSFGALRLTSRSEFRRPFEGYFAARVETLPYGCSVDRVEALLACREEIAAAVVEPIAGREGVILPPPGWMQALQKTCRRHGVALIADEIFTGMGRTGRWFAVEHDGVAPDLLCCGKAMAGGLPIAAVVGRAALLQAWKRSGEALHTGTFVAQPLACAAALAVLRIMRAERLPQRAARLGKRVGRQLQNLSRRSAVVVAVRGRGLMWGIELVDRSVAHRLATALEHRGVLALVGGPEGRVLQLTPALTIARRQLDVALDILAACLATIDPAPLDDSSS